MAKYVVAVDEDEVSAYAFAWAAKNLFAPGDSVTLITATFSDSSLPSADVTAGEYAIPIQVGVPAGGEQLKEAATALIDKFMKLCEQAGVKAEGLVVEGSPGPHIVSFAEKNSADAIVVGSHGKGVISRTFLGSISDYVRHHSKLSVVVVRLPKEGAPAPAPLGPEGSEGSPRKIVAAVDETPEASHAFAWALQRLVKPEDSLLALHVQNPLAQPTAIGTDQLGMEDVYVPPDTTGRASVEALGQSEKLVELFMKQAAEVSKVHCEGRVVAGATQDKIVHELNAYKADAVVVGTRQHDVIQRTFLGSVSDYLAHNSPCPVIFVKLPKNVAEDAGKVHYV